MIEIIFGKILFTFASQVLLVNSLCIAVRTWARFSIRLLLSTNHKSFGELQSSLHSVNQMLPSCWIPFRSCGTKQQGVGRTWRVVIWRKRHHRRLRRRRYQYRPLRRSPRGTSVQCHHCFHPPSTPPVAVAAALALAMSTFWPVLVVERRRLRISLHLCPPPTPCDIFFESENDSSVFFPFGCLNFLSHVLFRR